MRRLLGGFLGLLLAVQPALASGSRIVVPRTGGALPGVAAPLSLPDAAAVSLDSSLSVPSLALDSALPAAAESYVIDGAVAPTALVQTDLSEAGRVGAAPALAAPRDPSGAERESL